MNIQEKLEDGSTRIVWEPIAPTKEVTELYFGGPEVYKAEGPRIPPTYAHTTKPRTLNRAGRRAQKRVQR